MDEQRDYRHGDNGAAERFNEECHDEEYPARPQGHVAVELERRHILLDDLLRALRADLALLLALRKCFMQSIHKIDRIFIADQDSSGNGFVSSNIFMISATTLLPLRERARYHSKSNRPQTLTAIS